MYAALMSTPRGGGEYIDSKGPFCLFFAPRVVAVGSRLVVSAFFAPDLINVINVTVHSAWWVQDLDVNLRIDWTQHVCHLIDLSPCWCDRQIALDPLCPV